MAGPECQFSFADLFVAAKGRMWNPDEEAEFKNLTQDQRNEWVSILVSEAPQFITQDKIGADGLVYRAFWIP